VTVAVTGATGFLGRHVVKRLREDGHEVRCLTRASSDVGGLRSCLGDLWEGVQICEVSLLDVAECRRALDGSTVVFHAAAGKSGSTARLFMDSVVATRGIVQAAAEAKLRRLVLVSSYGVYDTAGLSSGTLLDEEVCLDPNPHLRDPYSYSKIAQEQAAVDDCARLNLPLVVVRPGVITGPGTGSMSTRVGLGFGPLLIRMGGNQSLPYVDVDDCAAAVVGAGLTAGVEGESFNVIGDDLPTGKRVLQLYRRSGIRWHSVWLPQPTIQAVARAYEWYHRVSRGQVPDTLSRYKAASMWKPLRHTNDKAKRLLGWQPVFSFDEAFQRSLLGDA
jgi:nucleoside-diphosphate-sugar epimerase